MNGCGLSPEGVRRRSEILERLIRAQRRRRAARIAGRGAVVAALALAVGVPVRLGPAPSSAPPADGAPVRSVATQGQSSLGEGVEITTDELLRLLEASGKGAGVIRRGDRLELIGVDVRQPGSPQSPGPTSGLRGHPAV